MGVHILGVCTPNKIIAMIILKKTNFPVLTKEEESFRSLSQNSPLAKSLKEHIDKYYPKADHGIIIEGLENATS